MTTHSSSSYMPSPSPSNSSLRSYRPYQHSVDSKSISATSPANFEHLQQYNRPVRHATMESSGHLIRDVCEYSRRQLSIEAVHCIFVDESGSSGTLYTFLVKPTLLQTGRAGTRSGHNKRCDGSRSSEQITRIDTQEEDDPEQQQELEPYQVEKTSRELLELSNRLVTSFDILLDPRRGGPTPLSKDLLMPKWNVKDMFRRRKKSGTSYEAHLAEASSVVKKDVVNDFFQKVLRTGGEVLSSSRAMQDFFDRAKSPVSVGQRDERVVPPTRPVRPALSALQIVDLPSDEATEHLTASPSWKSTPLSTPISAARSESKLRLWKKMQAESAISTPTRKGQADSMHHSNSYSDTSVYAQHEVMMGDTVEDAGSTDQGLSRQGQLHTLMKSISQQDLQSELTSWRHEVNRASHQRMRKTSEASSMKIVPPSPARGMQMKQSASPNTKECHSAQLLQVSAIAVKAKASGWKMTKGGETPLRVATGQKLPAQQRELLIDGPSTLPSSDLTRQHSQSSLAVSFKSGVQAYVPSELEKLIFGNGAREEGDQVRQPVSQRYRSDYCSIESTEDEEYMKLEGSGMSIERTSSKSSSQSEHIASYKIKGRAAVLRLNLSGRSNLHTESMAASAPAVPTSIKPNQSSSISIHSSCSDRVGTLASKWRESCLDPDMSSSPQHSPSSAATTQSLLQYEAIPLLVASDTNQGPSSETRIEKNIDKQLRSLTLASRGHTSHVNGAKTKLTTQSDR